MDSSDVIQLLTLITLIFPSAFSSSLETVLTTANRIRTRNLAEAGDAGAIILTKVIEDQGKMLSAILIGNNVVNLYASSLVITLAISVWGNKMIGVATGILALMIPVLGEITPKALATLSAGTLSLRCAKIIYGMMVVLTLATFVVNQLPMGVLFLFRIGPNKKREAIIEDELCTTVEVSHEEGVIEPEERKMINNVFDFDESLVRDIMVPRIDMTFANMDTSHQELIDIFREEKYIRISVYEDTTDNVTGVINTKDLPLLDDRENFSIRNSLRQPPYTYKFKKTSELMIEMRQAFNNIVIAPDEYGSTAGSITLEDMLEGTVGEICDKYDEGEEESLAEANLGEHLVEGSTKPDDLNDWLGLSLESKDYDSIGGLVIGLLDHLPDEGEEVICEGIRLVVEKVDKNRIENIRMFLPQSGAEEAETEEAQKK